MTKSHNRSAQPTWAAGWDRAAGFVDHWKPVTRTNVAELITGKPVDACVWRSDVGAALAGDRDAAVVFGNWLSVMGIDSAFRLDSEVEGPLPVMLLRHFLNPQWVENADEQAVLSAVPGVQLLKLSVNGKSFASEEEADAAAADRTHNRKVNLNRIVHGICGNVMRQLKDGREAPLSAPGQVDDSVRSAFEACLTVCHRVAAMYPVAVWPDNAASPEPSAAQLGRTVAQAIAEQIRVLRDR